MVGRPGALRRIVLWRHGITDYNVQWRIQGQSDIALNSEGLRLAVQTAPALAALGPSVLAASDLVRATATAAVLGELTGLGVVEHAGLRERDFGPWEGLTRPEIEAGWPADFERWATGGDLTYLGIEDRGAVGLRVSRALEELSDGAGEGGTVVAVSHGAAIRQAISHMLGYGPDEQLGIGHLRNCHFSILEHRPNPRGRTKWALAAHNVGPSY